MTLVGSKLGGYDVVAPLGAGGMGEVYRARDPRLQRDVALKVLPAALTADPERLARFEHEARVLASLNHPHIAAIYGLAEHAGREGTGTPVLVLELVEGETLQDAIARGPLPIDDALAIALQIADAVEAAHDRGIVHRDLKPGNVKLTPEGKVKVLDFGLAKALEARPGDSPSDPALSPTFTAPATELGMILGTAAYMAPEQARGKAVDRRADVWAFGALLYEMLTGARAFPGETVSDTLAAVLKSEPDWGRLPPPTPRHVRRLLARCLERDPRQRLQAMGEARIMLSAPVKDDIGPGRRGLRVATAAVVTAAVAAAAFAAGWWLKPQARIAVAERRLDLAADDLQFGLESSPRLSPDGQRIVYRANGRLWVRGLDGFAAKPIAAPAGAVYPFWSPDSRQVAFVHDRKLWRVAIDGGDATLIGTIPADMGGSAGGVWTDGNDLVLAGSDAVGLYAIPHGGGAGREILTLDPAQETDFHEIAALPGNRGLLFTTHRRAGPDAIVLFADGTRRIVFELPGETLRAPAYAEPGYLLFARESTSPGVWAVRFSLDTLEASGSPFLVAAGASWPSAGRDGTIAFVRASDQPSQLVWVDRTGTVLPFAELPGQLGATDSDWSSLSLSPDRQRGVFGLRQGTAETDVWSYDFVRGNRARLSVGADMVVNPTWSADGRRIFFAGFLGQRTWNIYSVPATEAGKPQRLLAASDEQQWPCTVSPDGKWIVYAQGPVSSTDLRLAALDGSAEPAVLFSTPFREIDAKFSPDGKWLAYTSNESGRAELYVRGFPIRDDRVQVSAGGATLPAWAPDGRELYYRTASGVLAATITPTPHGVQATPPRQVFAVPDSSFSPAFAVSSDGQRLLFARARGADRLGVILNWTPGTDDRR